MAELPGSAQAIAVSLRAMKPIWEEALACGLNAFGNAIEVELVALRSRIDALEAKTTGGACDVVAPDCVASSAPRQSRSKERRDTETNIRTHVR